MGAVSSGESSRRGSAYSLRRRSLFADGQHAGPAAHVPAGEVQRQGASHPRLQGPLSTGPACGHGASHPEPVEPQLGKEQMSSELVSGPLVAKGLGLPFDPLPPFPRSSIL